MSFNESDENNDAIILLDLIHKMVSQIGLKKSIQIIKMILKQ